MTELAEVRKKIEDSSGEFKQLRLAMIGGLTMPEERENQKPPNFLERESFLPFLEVRERKKQA